MLLTDVDPAEMKTNNNKIGFYRMLIMSKGVFVFMFSDLNWLKCLNRSDI